MFTDLIVVIYVFAPLNSAKHMYRVAASGPGTSDIWFNASIKASMSGKSGFLSMRKPFFPFIWRIAVT